MRQGKGLGRRHALLVAAAMGLLAAVTSCSNGGTPSSGPAATQTLAGSPASTAPSTTAPSTTARPRAAAPIPAASAGTCGAIKGTPHISKVVWIWFENKPYGRITPAAAPYFYQIKRECGYASHYTSVTTCNSLPEYIASTSGSPHGVCDNDLPSAYPLNVDNVFRQIDAAKKTWRSYQEGMTGNCLRSNTGRYAVKHNAAPYYTGASGSNSCAANNVPLPAHPTFAADFTIVEPDLCHSMHDCSVSDGDQWLRRILPQVIASPDYQAGNTAVFVTFDEGHEGEGEVLFTLALSRYTVPGTVSATAFNHYSLLRTTQRTLGLPCLLNSCHAPDMGPAFGMG